MVYLSPFQSQFSNPYPSVVTKSIPYGEYRNAVNRLYARLRNNYDFLYRYFGEDGMKPVEEMSREFGISVAKRAKAKSDISARVCYSFMVL
jgi:hypothetical protein